MQPPKPTIDMEFRYENHIPSANSKQPRINAHQIREAGYWNMLAGAAGLGYGAQDIWQFFEAGNPRLSYADYSLFMKEQTATHNWRDAINYEGSYCMGLLRRLLEMRPWHQLVPDQGLIHFGQGILEDHIQSARAADGAFALAYTPFGHPFTVQMDRIAGAKVKAHWYDPRTGRWKFIGEYPQHRHAGLRPAVHRRSDGLGAGARRRRRKPAGRRPGVGVAQGHFLFTQN